MKNEDICPSLLECVDAMRYVIQAAMSGEISHTEMLSELEDACNEIAQISNVDDDIDADEDDEDGEDSEHKELDFENALMGEADVDSDENFN